MRERSSSCWGNLIRVTSSLVSFPERAGEPAEFFFNGRLWQNFYNFIIFGLLVYNQKYNEKQLIMLKVGLDGIWLDCISRGRGR